MSTGPNISFSETGLRSLARIRSRYMAEPLSVLVFEHLGAVGSDDIPRMLALAEDHSQSLNDPVPVTKRLMNVLVEAVDNLNRHCSGRLGDATFALLVRDRFGYRLATGNVVPCVTGAMLSERGTILNMMGKEDLKAHYMKILTGAARSSNGGAGLGLLTLARKGQPPLVMSCDRLSPFTSYFTLEVRVGGQEDYFNAA